MVGARWRGQDKTSFLMPLGGRKMLFGIFFLLFSAARISCWDESDLYSGPSYDYRDILKYLMEDQEPERETDMESRILDETFSRTHSSRDEGFYPELEEEVDEAELRNIINYILNDLEESDGGHDEEKSRPTHDGTKEYVQKETDTSSDDIMAFFKMDKSEMEEVKNMLPNWIKVAEFLKVYQGDLAKWRTNTSEAEWTKSTNLTKHNIDAYKRLSLEFSQWLKVKRQEASNFRVEGLTDVQKRMMKFITRSIAIKEKELERLNSDLEANISTVYSNAQVCDAKKCYHFEPGLINLLRTSRDYERLVWAWKGWRDAIGPKIRNDWIAAEKLSTLGAKEHGFHDRGQYIRDKYEDPQFVSEIDELWSDIEPFYQHLHAYVRYKLHKKYGGRVALDKPIPAHLLGDMWAMKWDGILDLVQPYPKVGGFDVTEGMKEQNMTTHQMFVLADNFYQSIGLPAMPPAFWNKSMFTRPKDGRPVICYASAHNMGGNDVRVKMCAEVNAEYLYVVHHEMGHCQYYLAYNNHQPVLFQAGANNGFHEAIGDTAALSVISPTHLYKLGILHEGRMTAIVKKQKDLNFLMEKALAKIAFYPFAMTMAKWRWAVYAGNVTSENLNAAWWQYKKRYQGIAPPVERSENDFDPGCKYHIAYFVPYVRYFVSHVLQFQFYESMCKLANQGGPLHKCDFQSSKEAGKAFEKMLKMGSSKPWPDALHVLTGTRKMSVQPMLRYFSPLLKWLKKENQRLGLKIGWN